MHAYTHIYIYVQLYICVYGCLYIKIYKMMMETDLSFFLCMLFLFFLKLDPGNYE